MMKFTDSVVLVAGGTGGLGRAVSLAFLNAGARVIATWRNDGEFAALQNAAGANSPKLSGQHVDVTAEAAVEQLIEEVVANYGRLDVLVNCVGGYAGGAKLWETDTATFERMLTLNLRSGFMLSRAAAKAMLPRSKGVIVNVAARAALDHAAGLAAYASSKAAALAMIECLAADLKGTGVRANSILPGIIDTEPNRNAMPGADHAQWPEPEDIARVILFLCGDDAELIHGAAIPVYGNS